MTYSEEGVNDRRQISMPLFVYETDLAKAESRGQRNASRRMAKIIEASKNDPRDAVCMVVEDFEGDQQAIDRILLSLGLMEVAQKIWGSNAEP